MVKDFSMAALIDAAWSLENSLVEEDGTDSATSPDTICLRSCLERLDGSPKILIDSSLSFFF